MDVYLSYEEAAQADELARLDAELTAGEQMVKDILVDNIARYRLRVANGWLSDVDGPTREDMKELLS